MRKRIIIIGAFLLSLYVVYSGLLRAGAAWIFDGVEYDNLWDSIWESYGVPFGHFCVTTLYSIYIKCTLYNALVFIVKYLSTGLFLHMYVKTVYSSLRKRLRFIETEMEDIVLEVAVVTTKLSMREAESAELAAHLRRWCARVHAVRAAVRDVLAAEPELRAVLERLGQAEHPQTEHDTDLYCTSIVEILQELTHDKNGLIDNLNNMSEYGHGQFESVPEHSEYSSALSEADERDCRIKVIRVYRTPLCLYRVACLKYIKQKKLRRANKHIMLKKKLESTKKMLESWQKSLNCALCSRGQHDETAEAMGDYSKPRESETDSDLRDSCDDYPVWDQPAPSGDYFQEPESSGSLDGFEPHDYNDKYCGNFYEEQESSSLREESHPEPAPSEGGQPLPSVVEETTSQLLAIHDINNLDRKQSSDTV